MVDNNAFDGSEVGLALLFGRKGLGNIVGIDQMVASVKYYQKFRAAENWRIAPIQPTSTDLF